MAIAIAKLPEEIQRMLSNIQCISMEATCIVHRYSCYADIEVRGKDEKGRPFLKVIPLRNQHKEERF